MDCLLCPTSNIKGLLGQSKLFVLSILLSCSSCCNLYVWPQAGASPSFWALDVRLGVRGKAASNFILARCCNLFTACYGILPLHAMTCYGMLQHDRQCVAATDTVLQTSTKTSTTLVLCAVLQSDMHDMTSMHAILPTAFWLTARRVCVCVLCDFCWTQPRGSHVASLCTCVSHAL